MRIKGFKFIDADALADFCKNGDKTASQIGKKFFSHTSDPSTNARNAVKRYGLKYRRIIKKWTCLKDAEDWIEENKPVSISEFARHFGYKNNESAWGFVYSHDLNVIPD